MKLPVAREAISNQWTTKERRLKKPCGGSHIWETFGRRGKKKKIGKKKKRGKKRRKGN